MFSRILLLAFTLSAIAHAMLLPTSLYDGNSKVALLSGRALDEDGCEHNFKIWLRLGGKSVPVRLGLFSSGSYGCVYHIVGESGEQMAWNDVNVVVKVGKARNSSIRDKELKKEIIALEMLDELYHKEDVKMDWGDRRESHSVLVIKEHKLLHLWNTEVWMSFFGKYGAQDPQKPGERLDYLPPDASAPVIAECGRLLNWIQNKVSDTIIAFANKKRLLHKDYHYGNILFSNDLETVELIDWGNYKRLHGDALLTQEQEDYIRTLVERFEIPVRDKVGPRPNGFGGYWFFQGICDSLERSKGRPGVAPFYFRARRVRPPPAAKLKAPKHVTAKSPGCRQEGCIISK